MTDEIRTRDDLKRKYVEPMVAHGYPRDKAVKTFDIAYNIVDQMKERIPEEAHKFADDQEEFSLIVSMAARMGQAMCRGMFEAMVEVERESHGGGMGGLMDQAIITMLKLRGFELDNAKHGVIVHMREDGADCTCESCKWYADAAKLPGMHLFTISDTMNILVGPRETIEALDDARNVRRNGETVH